MQELKTNVYDIRITTDKNNFFGILASCFFPHFLDFTVEV